MAKVPRHAQEKVKAEFWAISGDIEASPGQGAVHEAKARARRFATKWRKLYPGMVTCFKEDQEALFAHLRLPKAYWTRCRHSNLVERTFGETRRRVKVIGRLPGEQSCLSLCWAVADRASKGWRGIEQTLAMIRLLHELRRELYGEAVMREQQELVIETDSDVTPAAQDDPRGVCGPALLHRHSDATTPAHQQRCPDNARLPSAPPASSQVTAPIWISLFQIEGPERDPAVPPGAARGSPLAFIALHGVALARLRIDRVAQLHEAGLALARPLGGCGEQAPCAIWDRRLH